MQKADAAGGADDAAAAKAGAQELHVAGNHQFANVNPMRHHAPGAIARAPQAQYTSSRVPASKQNDEDAAMAQL